VNEKGEKETEINKPINTYGSNESKKINEDADDKSKKIK